MTYHFDPFPEGTLGRAPASFGRMCVEDAFIEKFRHAGLKVQIISAPPSAFDPTGSGAKVIFENISRKLVMVEKPDGGARHFLEPGEKLTLPWDQDLVVQPLNNGV